MASSFSLEERYANRGMIKVALWCTIVVGVVFALLCWLAHDLSAPKRVSAIERRASWLQTPAAHGVDIEEKWAGKTPYYIVHPSGALSQRGRTLRDQLEQRGVELPAFGQTDHLLVICHGRKGNKADMLPIAERYAAVGYRCLIPDLPAHGESRWVRSHFGTRPEVRASLLALIEAERQANEGVVLWGMSMGGSFVAQLATGKPEAIEAVIVINSFDELENVVRKKVGRSLTVVLNWLSTHLYGFDVKAANSRQAMAQVDVPVFIAHGDQDSLIPFAYGRRLYESVRSERRQWVEVSGADHYNVLITEHELYADSVEFLRSE